MAVGGNVEVKSLTDFQAVNNLYVSGTILTSGSIQLGFSLVDGDSDLILSSSATSRVVVSGTLNVLEQLLVQGIPLAGTAVTGSRDFFVQNILDISGTLRNPIGHLILSSSVSSRVTVSSSLLVRDGILYLTDVTAGSGVSVRKGNSAVELMTGNASGYVQVNALNLFVENGSAGVIWNGKGGLYNLSSDGEVTVYDSNVSRRLSINSLSGSIIARNTHLVLSSSNESFITVSGTLKVTSNLSGAGSIFDITNASGFGVRLNNNNLVFRDDGSSTVWTLGGSQNSLVALKIQGNINNSTTAAVNLTNNGSLGNGSGNRQVLVQIDGNIGQSAASSYTALLVNPTELSTGSGRNLLLDLQLGNSSKIQVDNSGVLNAPNTHLVLSNSAGSKIVASGSFWPKAPAGKGYLLTPDGNSYIRTDFNDQFLIYLGNNLYVQMTTSDWNFGASTISTFTLNNTKQVFANSSNQYHINNTSGHLILSAAFGTASSVVAISGNLKVIQDITGSQLLVNSMKNIGYTSASLPDSTTTPSGTVTYVNDLGFLAIAWNGTWQRILTGSF